MRCVEDVRQTLLSLKHFTPQALEHGHIPVGMKIATVVMLAAAFLPPLCRVFGFTGGVVFIFAWCTYAA